MSCVDPKNIPQSLLPLGLSRKKEIDAIGTLYGYSFISRRPADLALDLHRLVHLATRNWLRKEKLPVQWTERAIARLEEVFPDHGHKNRSVWRMYLPHARYVLESDIVDLDGEKRMNLIWRYGNCLYSDGRWNEAEGSFGQVMEIRKRVLGADHPSTLSSMNNLASTYWNQGRWEEAEELQVQVMETSKKKLGADHPDALRSMNILAIIWKAQGRATEAIGLVSECVRLSERVLGASHPHFVSFSNAWAGWAAERADTGASGGGVAEGQERLISQTVLNSELPRAGSRPGV